ncbi:hypothetical protein NW762_011635 [Fusarium torreyae]|uniref:Uncharacterized protein n=1 Tax=Fusarium torreyae TaxID=1237075 RepID=A0A9W8RRI8_9HYPO|nr:hypothetical protein NW762_011635 [Fusarium torreyae]
MFGRFKPLTVVLGEADPQSTWRKNNISLLDVVYHQWRRNKLQARDSIASARLSDELPPVDVIRLLVSRYFETFHTIFPVLNEVGFTKDLNDLLENLSNTPFYLLVQVILVLALANGTYSPSQAPIPQSKSFVWLDLASSVPTTALELDECSIDTLRVIALLNTAKQALKLNETADYVYSGAGVRFSMMLGLNRTDVVDKTLTQIWDTVRELDLHACLACGAAPTVSSDKYEEFPKRRWADQGTISTHESYVSTEALHDILRRSRDTRTKITTLVNTEQHLQFQDVMALSQKLANDMAPISNNAKVQEQQSFAYKYVLFVYQKFLATLHRPFAPFRDPVFYLSRDITRNQAQDHYRQVCAAFRGGRNEEPFAALIAGNGTMFRIQAIQSALWLSFELYREDDYDVYVPGITGSGTVDKATIETLLSEGIVYAEKAIRTHELAGAAFLVPSLVLHHRAAIQRGQLPGSQQYHDTMSDAGKRLKDKLTNILV